MNAPCRRVSKLPTPNYKQCAEHDAIYAVVPCACHQANEVHNAKTFRSPTDHVWTTTRKLILPSPPSPLPPSVSPRRTPSIACFVLHSHAAWDAPPHRQTTGSKDTFPLRFLQLLRRWGGRLAVGALDLQPSGGFFLIIGYVHGFGGTELTKPQL